MRVGMRARVAVKTGTSSSMTPAHSTATFIPHRTMPNMSMVRVYTKTGDQGATSLFDGTRVDKDDLRVEAYGTVDELNSVLSLARLATAHDDVRDHVRGVQRFLFVLGADLSTPPGEGKAASAVRRTTGDDVTALERLIDTYWAKLTDLDSFVVPGETEAAAHFHVARTVCRRAERCVVHVARTAPVNEEAVRYLNRLSDLLFTWGRHEDEGVTVPDRIGGLRSEGAGESAGHKH